MTHSAIIDIWPSLADFASDLSIPYGTAKAMRRRNSIPAHYWNAVVTGALKRSLIGVSLQDLADAVAMNAGFQTPVTIVHVVVSQ